MVELKRIKLENGCSVRTLRRRHCLPTKMSGIDDQITLVNKEMGVVKVEATGSSNNASSTITTSTQLTSFNNLFGHGLASASGEPISTEMLRNTLEKLPDTGLLHQSNHREIDSSSQYSMSSPEHNIDSSSLSSPQSIHGASLSSPGSGVPEPSDTQSALVRKTKTGLRIYPDTTVSDHFLEQDSISTYNDNAMMASPHCKAIRTDEESDAPSSSVEPLQQKTFDAGGAKSVLDFQFNTSKFSDSDSPFKFGSSGYETQPCSRSDGVTNEVSRLSETSPKLNDTPKRRINSCGSLNRGSISSKKSKEPLLFQQFPSSIDNIELKILFQPEEQHRARYKTEGSRGAVKDRNGSSYPAVELVGYDASTTLQIFVATDTGKIKPHGCYQACKVSGKNSKPCNEKIIEGNTVIETELKPENDMIASIDSVGILKLRNVDVERRFGTTKNRKKSTKTRLAFRTRVLRSDGTSQILQIVSEPILCTQPIGVPEISKISHHEGSAMGGQELFIIGKNFVRASTCKVVFQEWNDNDQIVWEDEAIIDKDYFQNTHLICKVPSYRSMDIKEPVGVSVVIICCTKSSDPSDSSHYTYLPVSTMKQSMEFDQRDDSFPPINYQQLNVTPDYNPLQIPPIVMSDTQISDDGNIMIASSGESAESENYNTIIPNPAISNKYKEVANLLKSDQVETRDSLLPNVLDRNSNIPDLEILNAKNEADSQSNQKRKASDDLSDYSNDYPIDTNIPIPDSSVAALARFASQHCVETPQQGTKRSRSEMENSLPCYSFDTHSDMKMSINASMSEKSALLYSSIVSSIPNADTLMMPATHKETTAVVNSQLDQGSSRFSVTTVTTDSCKVIMETDPYPPNIQACAVPVFEPNVVSQKSNQDGLNTPEIDPSIQFNKSNTLKTLLLNDIPPIVSYAVLNSYPIASVAGTHQNKCSYQTSVSSVSSGITTINNLPVFTTEITAPISQSSLQSEPAVDTIQFDHNHLYGASQPQTFSYPAVFSSINSMPTSLGKTYVFDSQFLHASIPVNSLGNTSIAQSLESYYAASVSDQTCQPLSSVAAMPQSSLSPSMSSFVGSNHEQTNTSNRSDILSHTSQMNYTPAYSISSLFQTSALPITTTTGVNINFDTDINNEILETYNKASDRMLLTHQTSNVNASAEIDIGLNPVNPPNTQVTSPIEKHNPQAIGVSNDQFPNELNFKQQSLISSPLLLNSTANDVDKVASAIRTGDVGHIQSFQSDLQASEIYNQLGMMSANNQSVTNLVQSNAEQVINVNNSLQQNFDTPLNENGISNQAALPSYASAPDTSVNYSPIQTFSDSPHSVQQLADSPLSMSVSPQAYAHSNSSGISQQSDNAHSDIATGQSLEFSASLGLDLQNVHSIPQDIVDFTTARHCVQGQNIQNASHSNLSSLDTGMNASTSVNLDCNNDAQATMYNQPQLSSSGSLNSSSREVALKHEIELKDNHFADYQTQTVQNSDYLNSIQSKPVTNPPSYLEATSQQILDNVKLSAQPNDLTPQATAQVTNILQNLLSSYRGPENDIINSDPLTLPHMPDVTQFVSPEYQVKQQNASVMSEASLHVPPQQSYQISTSHHVETQQHVSPITSQPQSSQVEIQVAQLQAQQQASQLQAQAAHLKVQQQMADLQTQQTVQFQAQQAAALNVQQQTAHLQAQQAAQLQQQPTHIQTQQTVQLQQLAHVQAQQTAQLQQQPTHIQTHQAAQLQQHAQAQQATQLQQQPTHVQAQHAVQFQQESASVHITQQGVQLQTQLTQHQQPTHIQTQQQSTQLQAQQQVFADSSLLFSKDDNVSLTPSNRSRSGSFHQSVQANTESVIDDAQDDDIGLQIIQQQLQQAQQQLIEHERKSQIHEQQIQHQKMQMKLQADELLKAQQRQSEELQKAEVMLQQAQKTLHVHQKQKQKKQAELRMRQMQQNMQAEGTNETSLENQQAMLYQQLQQLQASSKKTMREQQQDFVLNYIQEIVQQQPSLEGSNPQMDLNRQQFLLQLQHHLQPRPVEIDNQSPSTVGNVTVLPQSHHLLQTPNTIPISPESQQNLTFQLQQINPESIKQVDSDALLSLITQLSQESSQPSPPVIQEHYPQVMYQIQQTSPPIIQETHQSLLLQHMKQTMAPLSEGTQNVGYQHVQQLQQTPKNSPPVAPANSPPNVIYQQIQPLQLDQQTSAVQPTMTQQMEQNILTQQLLQQINPDTHKD